MRPNEIHHIPVYGKNLINDTFFFCERSHTVASLRFGGWTSRSSGKIQRQWCHLRIITIMRKRFGMRWISSLPQLQETGLSCQLGLGRTRTIPTSKSQIVGKWPFLNHTKKSEHNGAHPPSSPNSKKTPPSPGWGWNECRPLQPQNRKSLEFRHFHITQKKKDVMGHPLFQPQHQESTAIS